MTILYGVILSIIEGVTEFLPISSTGHMILTNSLLGIRESEFVKSFEIIIQLAAVLAVAVLYWKKLLHNKTVISRVIVAFIPTAIIGFSLYKVIKTMLLGNPWIVVWSLAIGGILLILLEILHKEKPLSTGTLEAITLRQALTIGIAQSVSVIPGVSRSAATIVGALLLGVRRDTAVEFSFLLAIPTMAAATGFDFVKSAKNFQSSEYIILGTGFVVAFLTALVVVRWFIGFVKKYTFIPFGIYRICVAFAFYLLILRNGI